MWLDHARPVCNLLITHEALLLLLLGLGCPRDANLAILLLAVPDPGLLLLHLFLLTLLLAELRCEVLILGHELLGELFDEVCHFCRLLHVFLMRSSLNSCGAGLTHLELFILLSLVYGGRKRRSELLLLCHLMNTGWLRRKSASAQRGADHCVSG